MKATKVIKAVRAVKAKNTGKQKARRRLTTRVTGLLLAALAPALLLPGAAVSAQELRTITAGTLWSCRRITWKFCKYLGK